MPPNTQNPLLDIFMGGQMTDLPPYTNGFDPTALLEIVSPGTVAAGVNYAINLQTLASIMLGVFAIPTIITSGATVGSPYAAALTDLRILLNKSAGSASYVNIGGGAVRNFTPLMVRDILGDAATNNITVSFTGTVDGLSSPIVINQNYGGYVFNPLSNGNWYLTPC